MASMWPRNLPDWVLADPRRGAEIRIFRRFEKLLDDSWHVFYSRPWWGLSDRGGELDGEADFILVHAEHGLLFVEVKGGAVAYDPGEDKWSSRDSHGIRHNIKDPVKQAMSCKHRFLERLKKIPGWPSRFIRFRHGVILPDSAPAPASDPVVGLYEKLIFCFSEEFDLSLDGWVAQRLSDHSVSTDSKKESGPGEEGISVIRSLLANPVSLRVPLVREVQGELQTLDVLLTGAQLSLLSIIDSAQRALVEGGAGTGKTVLAVEMAARYAAAGKTVLFCCRSGPLATNVAERLRNAGDITVMKFDELATQCKWKEGGAAEFTDSGPWDVAVIDEGQDFDWEWWDLIDQVTFDGGLLRVFADSNQAVYRLRDDLETRLEARSFPLRINLRNTKAIAKVTESLYKGPLIEAPGPEGKWPEVSVTSDINQAIDMAVAALTEQIRFEGVTPSMIAVLVPNAEIREQIISALFRVHIPAANAAKTASSSVTVETVARFKGLEAATVILLADREIAKNLELSYVGVSRARSRLMVFGPIAGTCLFAAVTNTREK